MKTLQNNGNFATIINKGEYGFLVQFGYTHNTNDAYGNETCVGIKNYKTEKSALKFANNYINR